MKEELNQDTKKYMVSKIDIDTKKKYIITNRWDLLSHRQDEFLFNYMDSQGYDLYMLTWIKAIFKKR